MKAKFRGAIGKLLNRQDGGFEMNTSLVFGTDNKFGDFTVSSFKNLDRKEVELENGKTWNHSYIQTVDHNLKVSTFRFDNDANKVVKIVNEAIQLRDLHFQEQEFDTAWHK